MARFFPFLPPHSANGEQWLADIAKRMRSALLTYGFQAQLSDQRLTPNAALIRFQGSDRLKTADIEARRSQLLTTHELRVIRIPAEPGAVVVTIARPEREIVSLIDVLRNRAVDDPIQHTNQSLIVGSESRMGRSFINLMEEIMLLIPSLPEQPAAAKTRCALAASPRLFNSTCKRRVSIARFLPRQLQ